MFSKLLSSFRGKDSGQPTELCIGDRVKTLDDLCTGVITLIYLDVSPQNGLQKIHPGLHTHAKVEIMIKRGTNRSGLPTATPASFSQGLTRPESPTHEHIVFSALHLRRS